MGHAPAGVPGLVAGPAQRHQPAPRPVAAEEKGQLEYELRAGLEEPLQGLEVEGGADVAGVEEAEIM